MIMPNEGHLTSMQGLKAEAQFRHLPKQLRHLVHMCEGNWQKQSPCVDEIYCNLQDVELNFRKVYEMRNSGWRCLESRQENWTGCCQKHAMSFHLATALCQQDSVAQETTLLIFRKRFGNCKKMF